ncbi:MAG: hypothetical protein M3N43_02555, partial [Actinomycetota bacterium]|nr:hypothetical protein [Actinomycetota bacterium]
PSRFTRRSGGPIRGLPVVLALADDVENGEPAEVGARDSPEVFTSPRGNHYLGRNGPFEQR